MSNEKTSLIVRLTQALVWLAGASLVGMVGVVVLDVVGRMIFTGFSLNGSIELAVVCVVLLAYFGLPWAFLSNAHITVDVATAAAPEPVRRWLDAFWLFVSGIIAAIFCWLVLTTGLTLHGYGQVSETLGMSPLVTYGAGAFGLFVTALVTIYAAIVRGRTPQVDGGSDVSSEDKVL